jgi:hypothetical protein
MAAPVTTPCITSSHYRSFLLSLVVLLQQLLLLPAAAAADAVVGLDKPNVLSPRHKYSDRMSNLTGNCLRACVSDISS